MNKYFFSAFIALLSSCSLISPPVPPYKAKAPESWSRFENMPLSSKDYWPYTAWWQHFNDPVLNQLMKTGLQNNSTIKVADARLEQAHGQLKSIQLSWLPTTIGFGGYSSNPAFGIPLGFYGLWPQYALFNAFNTIAQEKSATLEIAIKEKAIEATRLMIISQIAKSYYTYIAELNQLKLLNVYIQDLNQILTIQQATYHDGLSTQLAIDTLVADLQNAEAQRQIIKDNLVKSGNAIHYLLDENPGPIIAAADFAKIDTHYPNVGALPAKVLDARPDVSLAELQFKLAVQNKALAYTSLLPAVQLDSFQGAINVNNPNTFGEYSDMNDAYVNWSVNPAVFGQIDTYTAAQKAAYHTYIDIVKKALQSVDNSLSHHQTANERYTLSYNAYRALKQRYDLTFRLYKTGIVSFQDTLTSKLAFDKAAIEVNQIKLIQMITLVNLYQELGGGAKITASS